MTKVLLTNEPIDAGAVSSSVAGPGRGAVVTFAGSVRDNSRNGRVSHLEYEAYVALARKQLQTLVEQVASQWDVVCAITHRLGRVEIGEFSVIVAVASPHRAAAFDACNWLVDALKATVPIWKKEYLEDGACWIEGSDAIPATNSQPLPARPHD